MGEGRPHPFVNWAGTARGVASRRVLPEREEEVVALLRALPPRGRVKVVGGAHSWSAIACPTDVLVSLDRMNRVLGVDRARGLVTVEAGIRLRDLNARLDDEGLAMSVLGSISEQSVAGAISTGTHGSGPKHGCLASFVTALRIVTADGEAHDVSASREPDLFAAAKVGLGALGVVTRVTLRCEPAFRLEERLAPMRFADAIAAIPALVRDEPYVKLWYLPHTDRVMVCRCRRTEAPSTWSALAHWFDERVVNRRVFPVQVAAGRRFPALVRPLNQIALRSYFRPRRRVARSDRILNIAMPPIHEECEYALPVERAADALAFVHDLIARERLRVNFVAELRFVAGDDAWMSPAFGRDTCFIGAYMARAPGIDRYFERFEEEMLAWGGRPHWGKQFKAGAGELRRVCPNFDRFAELRGRIDPRGTLLNPFLERLFALKG